MHVNIEELENLRILDMSVQCLTMPFGQTTIRHFSHSENLSTEHDACHARQLNCIGTQLNNGEIK